MSAPEPPVVLVTGASRGLGRDIALAFAASGARLALAARSIDAVDEVAAECGRHALPLRLDVGEEAACIEAVDRCVQHFGRVDVLVNNAGIAESATFLETTFLETDTALLRRTMNVDVEGPFWLTRAVLPGMLDRGSGRVISIASIAGRRGFAYVSAYTMAKHALLGLMRALAVEHASSGVTFNCICPYYIDTPMLRATVENIVARTGRSEQEAMRHLLNPQGRLIQTGEIAAMCLLLASESGRSINGQAINIDGGLCQS
jgi:NAD(P)-dependent dehydrogenase (short-subunit alcohol dehydrogenase family)